MLNRSSWRLLFEPLRIARVKYLSLKPPHIAHRTMKSYIIMFTEEATKEEMDGYKRRIRESGGSVKYEYDSIKGVAVSMPDDYVQTFANDPIVDVMEADSIVTTQG
ncbi:unnamed protein product [Rhizoctonia solani]|uniref:Inhibitor I9 domain-containing protein n=1 Tax=Rhizoctonia solani TaxID=456999 RepID=A0A8H2WU06_9AGAM|nr:unnamed protein product [Rhizoctonia solani]